MDADTPSCASMKDSRLDDGAILKLAQSWHAIAATPWDEQPNDQVLAALMVLSQLSQVVSVYRMNALMAALSRSDVASDGIVRAFGCGIEAMREEGAVLPAPRIPWRHHVGVLSLLLLRRAADD